jgi:hypothetical protein
MIEAFHLPQNCKVARKLFKKQFLENFPLSINEKKILSEVVDSITLEYLLNKDTINIIPYVDEEKDYSEIAFIKVDLNRQDKIKQITNIIQHIPYPLVVVFMHNTSVALGLSPKRINKADSSKLVVEENFFTEWIDTNQLSAIEKEFIDGLDIHQHPFTDFLSLYNSYIDNIVAFNASQYSGTLQSSEETKALLDEIKRVETLIVELAAKIQKETNFNQKVNMNIEMKRLKDKINELKESL